MKKVTRLGGDIKKKSTTRVAAYCRVSTDSDAQLESLEAQKTHYENYINGREDWEFQDCILMKASPAQKRKSDPLCLG